VCPAFNRYGESMDKQRLDLADQNMLADEALAHALTLPPGLQRNDALKLASQLRCAADGSGPALATRGRPKKCVP
jgi:hypothetical protein